MNPEESNYLKNLAQEIQELENANRDLVQAQNSQMNVFNSEQEDNLIRWQLDLKEDLDRIYHILKGDIVDINDKGVLAFIPQKNPNLRPFNEFGVQLIMNIIQFYLNRNTILSNYDEVTINWKIHDFGVEISDLIFNRYEEMMTTIESEDMVKIKEHLSEKIKLYPMIVRELIDTVHSAYLRAMNGGERESLRTARTVTQSEPLTRMNLGNNIPIKKSRWYNPTGW